LEAERSRVNCLALKNRYSVHAEQFAQK
jgi:hypothetical protein